MMGYEGVPDILIKRSLMKFFRVNWFELPDIPVKRIKEAMIVMEIEADLNHFDFPEE